MITPQTRVINGLEFEVTPLPAFRGLETLPRVTGFFRNSILALSGVNRDKTEAIVKALAELASSNPAELMALTKILLENTTVVVDGKRQHLLAKFDELMIGKHATTLRLLAFALEVNYADFFDEFGGLLDMLKKAFPSGLATISPTSGPAGAS